MPDYSPPHPDPEVDFVNLAKTIWQRKMLVIKLTGIAAIAGFLVSIMIPNRYTASTMLVQEISDPKITLNEARLSAISALAAVAGVNLHGLTKAKMAPPTFSSIISSIPFRKELMQTKLNFSNSDTATTLSNYYTKTSPVGNIRGLWLRIPDLLKGKDDSQNSETITLNIPRLTHEELEINKILDQQISIQILDDEYITIRCTLPGAIAAAQLTLRVEELLRHYITEIQTEKPRANLKFIQARHDEAKENFLKIQEELSASQAGNQEVRLSADYRMAEKIYLDLAGKLELSKIAINEQTPVFRIINPVTVPTGQSYPNRLKLTIISSFFGFVLAMALILGKDFIEDTKVKWRK